MSASSDDTQSSTSAVVLLHGLWTSAWHMTLMRKHFDETGFATYLFDYRTVQDSPEESASKLAELVAGIREPVLHLVGHSLGGIVIRHFLHLQADPRTARVVTLGTPHQPSLTARAFKANPLGRFVLGKALDKGLLGPLPEWDQRHELGSIAGSMSMGGGRLFARLPTPNDGSVLVEETRLVGMADHIVLAVSHTGLLLSPNVALQAIHFLRQGRFRAIEP
jgi:pimeloyl-ACP methyl ester carboxylesterase